MILLWYYYCVKLIFPSVSAKVEQNIQRLLQYPLKQYTFYKFTPHDKMGIIPKTHMGAHLMCDQESDIPFIIKHESIFQCHTHICCTYRVFHCMVIYLNILQCQCIEAYVFIVHTYVTRIIRRWDHTCLYMKPETRASIQRLCSIVTMQPGQR